MITMLSCFNLREGIDVETFRTLYAEFVATMEQSEMILSAGPLGRRERDTPMDTDEDRDHAFFSLMTFADRAQLDASYAYILERSAPGRAVHDGMFRWVKDPIFICWRDEMGAEPLLRGDLVGR